MQIIDFYNHLKTFGTPCSFDYRIFCDCSKLVSAVVVAFAVVVAVAVARILQVVDPGRDRATKCTRPETLDRSRLQAATWGGGSGGGSGSGGSDGDGGGTEEDEEDEKDEEEEEVEEEEEGFVRARTNQAFPSTTSLQPLPSSKVKPTKSNQKQENNSLMEIHLRAYSICKKFHWLISPNHTDDSYG
ncbi:hypothetical protein HZH66_012865 [Vespula vulgaris]|uniref:Uncharacterized protein n=1 Tax=Vespula vulgaris TaxID=7454 RepID=A0A834J8R6_VESVU|nr:hypothetical protein HZH66_012865 [Vespula vulgaris]